MDALLTQRHVAQTIVEKKDQVSDRQRAPAAAPRRYRVGLYAPPAGDRQEIKTPDIGHGRIEQRNITTSEALVGRVMTGPVWRRSLSWGVTSSPKKRARNGQKWSRGSPVCVLSGRHRGVCWSQKGQWQIENKSHWVRDVTLDEDRHRCAVATSPKSWRRSATPRLAC